jgi:hypothetical protein
VNFTPRGQISPLGAKFTPRGEIHPWGPGVKLRMALRVLIAVFGTCGQFLKLVFEPTGKIIILRMLMPRHIQSLF